LHFTLKKKLKGENHVFLIQKYRILMLLMTPYLVTIANDTHQENTAIKTANSDKYSILLQKT